MIRKYHNHKSQTTPWHREEEPLNHHETPGRQIKQSNGSDVEASSTEFDADSGQLRRSSRVKTAPRKMTYDYLGDPSYDPKDQWLRFSPLQQKIVSICDRITGFLCTVVYSVTRFQELVVTRFSGKYIKIEQFLSNKAVCVLGVELK